MLLRQLFWSLTDATVRQNNIPQWCVNIHHQVFDLPYPFLSQKLYIGVDTSEPQLQSSLQDKHGDEWITQDIVIDYDSIDIYNYHTTTLL